jgi:hypothetical protein
MATAFHDTFDRADGPPGDAWVVITGTWAILGNALKNVGAAEIRPDRDPEGADATQRFLVTTPIAFSKILYAYFRRNANGSEKVTVSFTLAATTISITISETVNNVLTNLATRTAAYAYGANVDLQCAVIGTRAIAWVDGYEWLLCRTVNITAQGHNSFNIPASTYIEEYWFFDYQPGTLGITITSGPDGNGDYVLDLTNGGEDWTAGTPGTPTFTAISGTVVSQVVHDTDTATVVWHPADIAGEDAIVDPLNDHLYAFGISFPPGIGGTGGGTGLTPTQSAALDALAAGFTAIDSGPNNTVDMWIQIGAIVLALRSSYTGGDQTLIGDIADNVAGTGANSIHALEVWSDAILTLLNATTDSGNWTLQYVWGQVKGDDNRDLTQIYDLLAALGEPTGGDLTTIINLLWEIRTVAHSYTLGSVIEAIAALPDPSDSLATIINILWEIRTVANSYTLADVIDAIAAIGSPDLSAVLDAIAAVRGSGNPDLAAVLSAIALIPTSTYGTQLTAIQDAVNAIPTNPITSLQTVLDAISLLSTALGDDLALVLAAIQALTPATPIATPPVWPGLAKATLGTPVSLATGVTITEAMDGVIVTVTGAPTKQGYFTFDDARSWRNIGALSFYTDTGAQEYPQSLGFESAIYCPKVMLRAAGVKVRCASGVTGTVTPWTIS